jgi:hypothetical protein
VLQNLIPSKSAHRLIVADRHEPTFLDAANREADIRTSVECRRPANSGYLTGTTERPEAAVQSMMATLQFRKS